MASTLTSGAVIIAPDIIDGYESTREAQSIVTRIIGRSDPDVTARPAASRTGTLSLVFGDEADAHAAELAMAGVEVWTFADPERPTLAMTFVVANGGVGRALESETRNGWLVSVPFVEVVP